MYLKDICIHGVLEWVEPKMGKRSSEYIKGMYPRIYCNIRGEACPFGDYHDCTLYEKYEKE